MEIYRNGDQILAFRFLMLDLAIWCILFLTWLQRNGRAAVRAVQVPWSMVALAVFTVGTGVLFGRARGLMEALQALDYYVLAYIVFALSERGLRKLPHIFIGLFSVVTLIGISQLVRFPHLPVAVSSIYEDRNVLGTVMVVIVPSVVATTFGIAKPSTRVFVMAIVLLGLAATTSAQALLAIALTGAVLSLASRGRRAVWAVLGVACVALLLGREGFGQGIFEPKDLAGYHERLQQRALMTVKSAKAEWKVARWALVVRAPRGAATPADSLTEGTVNTWRRDLLFGKGHHLRQEIIEYKAALGLFASSPLIGRGPGMYQEHVSAHYGVAPKLNSMEPNTQSGILVQAAQTGSLGTALLLAAVTLPIAVGWKRRRELPFSFPLAGAIGFLAGSLFLPVTQRPESLILIVALVAYARMEIAGARVIKTDEVVPDNQSSGDLGGDRERGREGRDDGGLMSAKAGETENDRGRRRRDGDHSPHGLFGGSSGKAKDGQGRLKSAPLEVAVMIGCVLALGIIMVPLLSGGRGAQAGEWMNAYGGIPSLVLALGLIAMAIRVRRLEGLRLSACVLAAWIFSEGSSFTLLVNGPGSYRIEFHTALLGMALLLACFLVSRAGCHFLAAPPVLIWITVVLLGALLGSALLWLPVRIVYGEPWRTLISYLWSFAVVLYVLVVSFCLLTTAWRARLVIGVVAVGLLLAGLLIVLPL